MAAAAVDPLRQCPRHSFPWLGIDRGAGQWREWQPLPQLFVPRIRVSLFLGNDGSKAPKQRLIISAQCSTAWFARGWPLAFVNVLPMSEWIVSIDSDSRSVPGGLITRVEGTCVCRSMPVLVEYGRITSNDVEGAFK